jgi:molecular chaperone GrpE
MTETPKNNARSQGPETGSTPDASAAPTDDVSVLKARLQAAEQARDQYLKMASQTQADFENYQKRAARDRAEERRYATSPFAGDLLPALDNLDRAIAAAEQAGDNGPLAQGVALVQKQLLDALKRHGISRVEAQGHAFDPNLHQAVMQQPSAEHPPMTVLQVLEQGYQLHDRVLRPARVIVSTSPS